MTGNPEVTELLPDRRLTARKLQLHSEPVDILWLMLSVYRYLLVAFICAAVLLILRYGYIAATESTSPKKSRATLIATLAFASFFVVLPLWWTGYEFQLPIFEFTGVIESIHIESSSSKSFSAELSILTASAGTITIHVSDRSKGWRLGQHLKVRYYGDTGELIRATFFDMTGKEEGVARRASWLSRAWSLLFGIFLIWGAWARYRRDPSGEVENEDELSSGVGDRQFNLDQQQSAKEELDQIKTEAEQLLAKQRKWAIIASGAFIASCASVWPFLAGNPLHRYWDTLGTFFLFVAMVLLFPFVITVGWAISAWLYARNVKRIDS